jgi:hypothetical protein
VCTCERERVCVCVCEVVRSSSHTAGSIDFNDFLSLMTQKMVSCFDTGVRLLCDRCSQ